MWSIVRSSRRLMDLQSESVYQLYSHFYMVVLDVLWVLQTSRHRLLSMYFDRDAVSDMRSINLTMDTRVGLRCPMVRKSETRFR
jgi:hypothetical protein